MLTSVLIESDWNLKYKAFPSDRLSFRSINRIRLEFKGNYPSPRSPFRPSVLIESDWNLKQEGENVIQMALRRINRIRLEFKGA